jgi:mono/diheme cytochrome c family protein
LVRLVIAILEQLAHCGRTTALLGGVSGLMAVLLLGCDLPGKPNPGSMAEASEETTSFATLFRHNCAGCHGANGQLGPAPPLNDPMFLAIVSDAELERVVRQGRRGTPMPAFDREAGGSLTDAQVNVFVEGIKSHWKTDEHFDEPPPAYLAAKGDDLQPAGDSRESGARVFSQACAGCHGEDGRGGEGSADSSNPINEPAFLALISNQALRRIIITGRPDLGMPNYSGRDGRPDDFQPLTSTQIDDLVALLASWRAAGGAIAVQDEPSPR